MESVLFLLDLLRGHEPGGGWGDEMAMYNAKGVRREGARRSLRTLRVFASFALCVE